MDTKSASPLCAVPVREELYDLFRRKAAGSGLTPATLVDEALAAFARQRGWLSPDAAAQPDRQTVAAQVLQTASQLERQVVAGEPTGARQLYVITERGGLQPVQKDRFLIGRGKHCDLVIDDSRISREHAAIVREDGQFWIEDLGSSNGTYFDRQRIGRRRIADGEEYFVCAEKVRCVFR